MSTHPAESISLNNVTCVVPCDDIVSAGPAPDGIPPIENPVYYDVADVGGDILPDDVVLGVEIDGQMYAYPYRILNYHEVLNHQTDVEGMVMSITYNMIFYDRKTETYWSQMMGLAIRGDLMGDTYQQGLMVEMTWSAFSQMYPDAKVLSQDTGHRFDYNEYPYKQFDYRESPSILFPTSWNPELEPFNNYGPKSVTTLFQVDDSWGLVPFEELAIYSGLVLDHEDKELVIFFDEKAQLSIVLENQLNGMQLNFGLYTGDVEIVGSYGLSVYLDQQGNLWNMKGEAIAGPNQGATLIQYPSYNGFWFAAIAMFPDATLYEAASLSEVSSIPGSDNTVGIPTIAIGSELAGERNTGIYTETENASFLPLGLILLMPMTIRRRK
ncbi:MAG: DUF3179 domain-containing (seleno)protein [Candidatus Kariarchaeaceae archaeon]|jgi:hypothetical protein